MASQIDKTKPQQGAALTESVRNNFEFAEDEINELMLNGEDSVTATGTNAIDANYTNDPTLESGMLFGFKLDGTRGQVLIYIHQRFKTLLKLIWPSTHRMNVKKIDRMKFPKEMTIPERFDWRKEINQYHKVKSQEGASEFFLKWAPVIAKLNPNHILKPC